MVFGTSTMKGRMISRLDQLDFSVMTVQLERSIFALGGLRELDVPRSHFFWILQTK
jgi:hypothetical protein